jgi:RNA polymerase sigma factor (sigma-70 family)
MRMETQRKLLLDPGPILQSYILESDEERSDRLLVELVCEYAQPVAKGIIASRLGADNTRLGSRREVQDADDVCNEVLIQLLRRLRCLKAAPQARTVDDFSAYVAATAFNACNHYLRKKYPERYRLKDRLRYALNKDQHLGLWEKSGRWICGLAEWRGEGRPLAGTDLIRISCGPDLSSLAAGAFDGTQREVAALLRLAFCQLGSPVELDDLVGEIIECAHTGSFERQRASLESASTDPFSSYPDQVEQHLQLRHLWSEIQKLPLRQRAALLLNLRDAEGREAVTNLVQARIATPEALEEALQLPRGKIVELWNRLPMDDATIADQFGLSRQQVVNSRLSARRRLARKMSSY